MCDYSLQGLPNRLANEGEQLVTHRFSTGSIGLASPAEMEAPCRRPQKVQQESWWMRLKQWLAEPIMPPGPPAVCIAPGTCLRMSRIPDSVRREFALTDVETVTFVQFSAEPFQYRDGIEFANGRRTLLQTLREGVAFEVLETVPVETEELRGRLKIVWPPDEVRNAGRPLSRVG